MPSSQPLNQCRAINNTKWSNHDSSLLPPTDLSKTSIGAPMKTHGNQTSKRLPSIFGETHLTQTQHTKPSTNTKYQHTLTCTQNFTDKIEYFNNKMFSHLHASRAKNVLQSSCNKNAHWFLDTFRSSNTSSFLSMLVHAYISMKHKVVAVSL